MNLGSYFLLLCEDPRLVTCLKPLAPQCRVLESGSTCWLTRSPWTLLELLLHHLKLRAWAVTIRTASQFLIQKLWLFWFLEQLKKKISLLCFESLLSESIFKSESARYLCIWTLHKSHKSLQITLKSNLHLYITELVAMLHLVFRFEGKENFLFYNLRWTLLILLGFCKCFV